MHITGITGVAVITALCYLLGEAVKLTRLNNKAIPPLCGALGALLGVAGLYLMPDFPASDLLTAAAVGAVSGLAATGSHEALKAFD